MPLHSYNATYPNIRIDDPGGASTYLLSTREALDNIDAQAGGQMLLQRINAGQPFGTWNGVVKILRPNTIPADINNPGAEGGNRAVAINELHAKGGGGTPSAVYWNPNIWSVPGKGSRPPFIGLAHELVHAMHNAEGTKKNSYDEEEEFTVGLGQYAVANINSVTENRIRIEHGIALRHEY